MQGNKRPLPLPEAGAGEFSRPRKRWCTVVIAIRAEVCWRDILGRRETGTISFTRLFDLEVQLVSNVKTVVQELCWRDNFSPRETGTVSFTRLLELEDRFVSMVKTVSEEINRALASRHAPQRVIPIEENHPQIELKFLDKVNQPVYTTFKVKRQNSQQEDAGLRVAIYSNNKKITSGTLASAEIEILVFPGEFSKNCRDNWTREEFQKGILVDREKMPSVLPVERVFKLSNGEATIDWLVFGDNSSWTRDKMFRLGIRVLNWEGVRIREGITEPFPVRDRRMEACEKHDPPVLSDEIWRLKKIRKNGDRCKILNSKDIYTVKDLLKSYNKDEAELRKMLGGIKKTSKDWVTLIGHAKRCADLADCNGAPDPSIHFPEIPSNHGTNFTCHRIYQHGSSSSQRHPLENQIINQNVLTRVSRQINPIEGYNSESLLNNENIIENRMECGIEFQAGCTAFSNMGLPQQVLMDEQIDTANTIRFQTYFDLPVNNNATPLDEVLLGRICNRDQFGNSSEALAHMSEWSVSLQTTGGARIVGSGSSVPNPWENNFIIPDTSILNVSTMPHPIPDRSQIVIPVGLDQWEELLADVESRPNNSSEIPSASRSHSFGTSCEAQVEGFIATVMSNSGQVEPVSPRMKAKIKVLFKVVTFLASLRKRTRRIVPHANLTLVRAC